MNKVLIAYLFAFALAAPQLVGKNELVVRDVTTVLTVQVEQTITATVPDSTVDTAAAVVTETDTAAGTETGAATETTTVATQAGTETSPAGAETTVTETPVTTVPPITTVATGGAAIPVGSVAALALVALGMVGF
ncbi:uncharacterized protein SPAPADRAFT_59496 [Spathaspora passalidarum NRRL Y-27907]|uniref:Uncharacterized protein n=1 Tax=Spathaspora passalidarum (strain NRRL Y-27907 / 11-Y1) TaxID=619300 RepID=G3AK18_SPAPN|nr:uncharacterized protein SPAPADRAFT_59496 [Spathaspora passalidarum NRRL Y-27907]EGW34069.1 hypothetical protein SPAPADRAFT_59496 [Spathaspora passalidarum NRRL Y-27907]